MCQVASVRIISPDFSSSWEGVLAQMVFSELHVELEESREQLLGQSPRPRGPGIGHNQEPGNTCSQVGQLGLPATASWMLSVCPASHPFSTGALKYHPTLSQGNSRPPLDAQVPLFHQAALGQAGADLLLGVCNWGRCLP